MKEFWNERYVAKDYFYGTRPNYFLSAVSGIFRENSNIICIGEGEGRNAVYLASLGHKVTAIDFSEEGKKKALALALLHKVEIDYQVCSLEDYDFGVKNWDVIVSIFCHLPPSARPQIHKRLETSLRAGGLFVIQAYNPKQLVYKTGGPKDISLLYTDAMIEDDFKYIEWIKLENSIKDISEGVGHTGISSVLSGIGWMRNL